VPLETPARIVSELASRGYNAEREAVTLLADVGDPAGALDRALETVPEDALVLTADHVRESLETDARPHVTETEDTPATDHTADPPATTDPTVSTGTDPAHSTGVSGRPLDTVGRSRAAFDRGPQRHDRTVDRDR